MRAWRRFALISAVLLSFAFMSAAAASPILKSGSTGSEVALLQRKLQEIGYAVKTVDGVFGQETKKAVEAFQRDQKIKVTGIVNNATWRILRQIKSPAPAKSEVNAKNLIDSGKAKKVILTARKYIGTPYLMGGDTPDAFDCSGYLQYVFRENGINIPRTADEQYLLGSSATSRKELLPGDLVFFDTDNSGVSHVGLYLGKNEFIHASSSKGVRIDSLDNVYWKPRYFGGKRIVG